MSVNLNPIDLVDNLSPHLTVRTLTAELHCNQCHDDQISLSFNDKTDGDLCLVEIVDDALANEGWCTQLGVCPKCLELSKSKEVV